MQNNKEPTQCKILVIDDTLVAIPYQQERYVRKTENALLQAVHQAYQFHQPLALSPDIIWLAIMQGFAIHVTENYEKLRPLIVDFDGKKELSIITDEEDFETTNAVDLLAGQIKQNIGDRLYKTCIPQFTTSNNVSLVAYQMTLMKAMEKYFDYTMMVCGCGIPKVKLLGTLEDWILLRNHAEKLRVFDLDWWIDKLLTVLDKLIAAYKGEINKDFWNDIYQYRQGGPSRGPESASGWITYFFPYDQGDNKKFYKSSLKHIAYTEQIPNGYCKVPVKKINMVTKEQKQIYFVSGFFGVERDHEGFLSPNIGWRRIE